MIVNKNAAMVGVAAAIAFGLLAVLPVQLVVVQRTITQQDVTDVITYRGQIVLVRKALLGAFSAGVFQMPVERHRLTAVKRSRHSNDIFDRAAGKMHCGADWRRDNIAPYYAFGELGKWRSFHTGMCDRAEIVSWRRIVYESIQLRRHLLHFATVVR